MTWRMRLARWLVGEDYFILNADDHHDTLSAVYACGYSDAQHDMRQGVQRHVPAFLATLGAKETRH
jgi:hypothetical protein